ncbi:amino acid adenylation domain-containing protein [Micromonospora sp. KLBMP9576]|uniref:amino acid adenylation domain-containing protein n=1 Tax=Micromonospora sp. KLBMP9576 TaxID=3424769 RepID=UPI003D950A81
MTSAPFAERPDAVSYGGDLPDAADHPRTLDEALLRAARTFPREGVRTVGPDGREEFVDHVELLARARAVLPGLRACGLRRGSHVILRITSGEQYWPTFWGCVLGGVVPLTVGAPTGYDADNPSATALVHAWRVLGEPVVLAGPQDLDALARLELRDHVVAVPELTSTHGTDPGPADVPAAAARGPATTSPESVALLQLSSGTTGRPKVIPLTHRGLSEYAVGARTMLDVGPQDVLLNWLPLDHSASLLLYHLGGVFLGATSVHVATERVLEDPLRWLELMRRHRVTHSWAPNFGLRLVADAVARTPGPPWDLRGVRRVLTGGEQCRAETIEAFVAATGVPASAMTPAWGMSETCTAITFTSFTAPGARLRIRTASLGGDLAYAADGDLDDTTEFVSVGLPAPGATLRILDPAGAVLPEGRVGRLQVSSARVTPGYLADPEATRLAFPDGDGWLETGDLAFMHGGRITITGRAKDLIILNGNNLPCHEVEQVAGEVDGVRHGLVAAVGVPDPRTGTESLAIFYVPDDTADMPPAGVAGAVSAAVARRWQVAPARVLPVAEAQFPRTSGGKIRRAELARRLLADEPPARPRDEPPAAGGPVGPGRAQVRAVLTGILSDLVGGPVDPARPFYELGVGSVEIVRLRVGLERALGRGVPQPVLFAHPTIDALSAHLAAPAATPTAEPTAGPARDRRIAVIGMAVRFPGAGTVEEYWANLTAGVESVRTFTPDELVAAGTPRDTVDEPGFVAAGGILDGDVAAFDAGFFSISPREAELLDPQHRLFLETCHHALEDAGHPGDEQGVRTALYAGSGMNLHPQHTYRRRLDHRAGSTDPADSIGVTLGNQPDFLATRVAYRLGLTGPAINVQNACSTSLVAVHLAVRALLDGEADQAVAGAVAVAVPQVTGYRHTPGAILSANGRCRPFDADADGTVGGNGVAAVVLKPLGRALADGDRVHAVIIGSALNNDGADKVGFTAPGVAGQVDVARRALAAAGITAGSVGYVEAHGTGTALGDPVEHHALAQVYAGGRAFLGSVKANIGHLDSCAGMAGLVKAILTVRSGRIAPQINFRRPHPAIDLAAGPFTVTTRGTDWPAELRPRRAAVSALGVGGTNAHVIVEEPPPVARRRPDQPPAHPAPGLLPLSAADPAALVELAARQRDLLRADPGLSLADLVTSAGRRRRHRPHRLVALGASTAALADALDRYVGTGTTPDVLSGRAEPAGAGPVAFAFPGQGDRRDAVLALAARFPLVRDVLAEGADAYHRETGGDLVARLREHPDGTGLPTDVAQPALVLTAVAIAELWRSWGIAPDVVVGHSVGEYAALVVAGALSLTDAVGLTARRGVLMRDALPPGAMLAVLADAGTVDDLLRGSAVQVAARNGAENHVLAGAPDAVAALARAAHGRGVATRLLPVDRAFHSTGLDAILDRLGQAIGAVEFAPLRLPLISTLDGRVRPPGWLPDAGHLCRQAREPVAWAAAQTTLAGWGVRSVVEAGADGTLTGIAQATGSDLRWVSSQGRDRPPVDGLWRAVAELHVAGFPVDWAALTAGHGARSVPLPAYPFQRRRFWASPPATGAASASVAPVPAGVVGLSGAAVPEPARSPAGTGTGADPVLARVRARTAERLGLDVADVEPDQSFLALGADSLLLIGLSREIGQAFGVRVPVRDLFATLDTPRRLAEAVTRAAPAATVPPVAPPVAPPAGPVPKAAPPVEGTAPPLEGTAPPVAATRGVPADLVAIMHRQLDLMGEQLALLRAYGTGGGTEPGSGGGGEEPAAADRPVPPAAVAGTPDADDPGPPAVGERPDQGGDDGRVSSAEAVETAPLTPGQRRLWLIEQAYPGTPAYTDGVAVRLRGALDPTALRLALQDVVDRHAPLRTTYREVDGEPQQIVRPTTTVELPVREHRGADEDAVVRAAIARESARVFDLVDGPVFAFELLRFSPAHHVLVMSFHHLATDGRSYAVLTREVGLCYRARSTGAGAALPPLPVTYPELARSRARSDRAGADADLAYWLDLLDPLPPTLVLPSDLPRPADVSAAGESLVVQFPAELAGRVRQLGRAARVTPFTILLSAIGVALFRLSGQPDLVVGTGMNGRDEDCGDLIGFFVDTVPLRLDLTGDPTFRELLARVQLRTADAYGHAGVPFDDLVRALAPDRAAGRHPLFDVVVEYEAGDPAFRFDLPGITAELIPVGLDKAPVDLVVHLTHLDTVRCHVEYRTDVFDRVTVRRFLDHVERLLDRATREPDEALSVLAAHLEDPAGRLRGPRTPHGDDRLHELFLRQAERTPDAVAVVCGTTRWTYRQLRERADLLARRIAAAGVGPDDLVAVLLPRRPELIAAQLAVLIAGAGFLPLDPGLPAARVAALYADSGARLLVTTADVEPPIDAVRLRVEDSGDPDLPAPSRVPAAEQLAWCVYTSGSTGGPKGVLVPHRAAVDAVNWHVRALALTGADTVGHALGLGFDANLAEIHPALAAGATVHLVPEQVRSDPAALVAQWAHGGVTVAFLPAPLAELVFALPMPARAPRTLVVGGSQLRRRPPVGFPAEVINAYGPTEGSIVTTAGPVRAAGAGPVDIGAPVDNRRLHLLDAAGVPVPRGAVGELHIGGAGVARGYHGRPGATAAAFLPDPALPGARVYRTGDLVRERNDGTLEFVGRVDDQVKIAGQRTEPGEAADALTLLPGVRQGTVVARHDRGHEPYLVAYAVVDDHGDEPVASRTERLAAALAERLPAHLVPRAWVLLDALPTTDNGKVDRSRLPAPEATGADERPGTALEQLVHDAWCAEIGVDRLPVDVPFFAAGGHSLAAVRLANRLAGLLDAQVGAHRVLRSTGIRAMARDLAVEGGAEVVDRAPATHQQELMWRRQRQAPDPPSVHMAVRVDLTGPLDVPALRRAVDGLVGRHESLRTRLVERDGELHQEVLAARPGTLPVRDLRADEVGRWCVRTGREPFPEDLGPWVRARLARLGDDSWVLMLVVHHLCGDGWSMLQLLDELGRGYAAETGVGTAPAAPTARYVEHARRQRAAVVAPAVLRYWCDHLAEAPRTVSLPTDRPRPARLSGRGSEYVFDVPAELTERLAGLAERCDTSMFPVLASGYALLVRELTGLDDVVLACPYAHRDNREVESVVGLFTSPLPLRVPLDRAGSFPELVAGLDRVFLDAIRHQPAPLAEVYAALDPHWRPGLPPPVATTLFGWNPETPQVRLPGLVAHTTDQGLDCARRDYITVVTPHGSGLRGVVEYSTDLFDRATVAARCDRFVAILRAAADEPTGPARHRSA